MTRRENGSTLLYLLTRQELVQRFSGSWLGAAWMVITPLMMLAVYFLIFGEIFRAKWPGLEAASSAQFALNLFAGLVAFQLFSDAVARSTTAITSQPNYVKKVVFPLAFLPLSLVLSSLAGALVSILLLIGLVAASNQSLPWTALWAPLALGPIVGMALAFSLFFSSLGVYFRDLSQVVGVFLSALMFLSPVFFPMSMVPAKYKWLFEINPLAIPIEQFRLVVVAGSQPDWAAMGWAWLSCGVMVALAWAWFGKSQRGFADQM